MMPSFRTKLSIPLAFCRQLNGDRSERAVLTSCKGSWNVKIGKCSKGSAVYFEEGWEDFVQSHGLNIGDFVVFEYKGHMVFDVLLFDSSACEKEFPPSIKLANKRKRTASEVNSHDNVKHSKGQSPLEAADSSSPGSPHFITTISAANGIRGKPYMNIPIEFVRRNDLTPKCSLTLRDPLGKLWSVNLGSRPDYSGGYTRLQIGGGWCEFYVSNKLKEGDVCIFELNHTRGSKLGSSEVLMDVRIFPLPT